MVHIRFLSLDAKCRVSPCRLQVYLLNLIDCRPLRPRHQIVLEGFNAVGRPFSECFNRSIGTVAHVPNNLMSRGRALRKETITNSLHFTSYQKLSRYLQHRPSFYLHLTNLPALPRSSVNVSVSSAPAIFNVNVIVLPLIVPA
jgi:hypothetical protein